MRLLPRFHFRSVSRLLLALVGIGAIVMLCAVTPGCRKAATPAELPRKSIATTGPALPSQSCRECHEEEFKAWTGSHHSLAHRPIDVQADADAFWHGDLRISNEY